MLVCLDATSTGVLLNSKDPSISNRIREVLDREESGNVAAAARKLGYSQRGLAKIYHGETQNPRADLLEAVVRVYEVDPEWLLTGKHPNGAISEAAVRREAVKLLRQLLDRL